MKLVLPRYIFEKIQLSNFIKPHLVGADLFHANGRTDRHDEADGRSSQFYEHA